MLLHPARADRNNFGLDEMSKSKPQLPAGNASFFRGISENFSFHASPETFITSRVLEFQRANPNIVNTRAVVRARVLNRDVAIVSSYRDIKHVLAACDTEDDEVDPPYVAGAAYEELMAPFFHSPNLLLADGSSHHTLRHNWEQLIPSALTRLRPFIQKTTGEHFQALRSETAQVDIYDSLKALSWKILLGAFLGLKPEEADFATYQSLHEVLLRGQFSLIPVSINAGIWLSPRQKGRYAKADLCKMIAERLKSYSSVCPFTVQPNVSLENIANHTLLFTSSLAVKGLASLLTAFLLNLYLFPFNNRSLAVKAASLNDEDREAYLRSILLETERLSPPIVGVMRRSSKENVIASVDGQANVLIPEGWDIWLYFVGGGRDPDVFGKSWDRFFPERYLEASVPPGFAFGAGEKTCPGQELVREIALTCANTCVEMRLDLTGDVQAKGVQGWLGWEDDDVVSPQDWAADMKQLPTQRPANPILVRIAEMRIDDKIY
jgi:cytochrome P450